MKQVTLCLPVFNSAQTIRETLESLVNQSYPIFKLKILDNCSEDSTIAICTEFATKYSYIEIIRNVHNIGAEANFSKCIQEAEGDYCSIVHADDVYHKDFIKYSIETCELNPGCIGTFCAANEIDGEGTVIGERFFPAELKNELTFLSHDSLVKLVFKYSNFITCPSVVLKSEIYKDKIKIWNGIDYKTSADLDVWLRASLFGSICAINKPLMNYRVAEASYSFRIAKKRVTRHDLFLVLENYLTSEVREDFEFLQLKDQSIRAFNIFRNKSVEIEYPIEVKFSLLLVLSKMLASRWHFEMGLAIISIHSWIFLQCLAKGSVKCRKS